MTYAQFLDKYATPSISSWLTGLGATSPANLATVTTVIDQVNDGLADLGKDPIPGGSGGVTPPPAGSIVLTPGTTAAVPATTAADLFSFDAVAALGLANDTTITITGFAVAADSLRINSTTASAAITTLAQLNGVDGIAVQSNIITGNTLINFGQDTNGDVVSITLVGVTDATLVNVTVI